MKNFINFILLLVFTTLPNFAIQVDIRDSSINTLNLNSSRDRQRMLKCMLDLKKFPNSEMAIAIKEAKIREKCDRHDVNKETCLKAIMRMIDRVNDCFTLKHFFKEFLKTNGMANMPMPEEQANQQPMMPTEAQQPQQTTPTMASQTPTQIPTQMPIATTPTTGGCPLSQGCPLSGQATGGCPLSQGCPLSDQATPEQTMPQATQMPQQMMMPQMQQQPQIPASRGCPCR